ncbi:HNH endonuclease [Streptomyces gardneri]|uniref:HNH endonuclease family protein n=1 Tax=Nocardia TaxID=1817 RepID=UPI001357C8AB|nr:MULTISPECIES: HNH endonuclease family protein [Nocardia]MBF6168088.1 HNH endonuclease [Streptomyces gardneri]MBF6206867.1 HNH endonuclease [Streptomyces gardneri]
MKSTAQRLALIGVTVAASVGLLSCSSIRPSESTAVECGPGGRACADAPAPIPGRDALALLNSLRVAERAPRTGYSRDEFGPPWSDNVSVPGGNNGCDTRNDILQRDLTDVTFKSGKCIVSTGTLADPYTGKTINFKRGTRSSDDVQIDHVVALSDAWQKGAQQLSAERRRDLANDPLNLQAVDGPTNQSKSDSDAAEWLPPVKGYHCAYLTRQIQVKAAYQLWVTPAEKDAMVRVLTACP